MELTVLETILTIQAGKEIPIYYFRQADIRYMNIYSWIAWAGEHLRKLQARHALGNRSANIFYQPFIDAIKDLQRKHISQLRDCNYGTNYAADALSIKVQTNRLPEGEVSRR